ncbi:MAG: hypothetical protein VCE74_20190 [Alphaproteobacteria bacterium]
MARWDSATAALETSEEEETWREISCTVADISSVAVATDCTLELAWVEAEVTAATRSVVRSAIPRICSADELMDQITFSEQGGVVSEPR